MKMSVGEAKNKEDATASIMERTMTRKDPGREANHGDTCMNA